MVKQPKTPLELIQNIKFALDNELFLRHEFYSEENLRRFFGARNVTVIETTDPTGIASSSVDFGEIVPSITSAGYVIPGVSFRGGVGPNSTGKQAAAASFSIRAGGPDFYSVQKIFGDTWIEDRSAPLHGPKSAPTGPHGNERWVFKLESVSAKYDVRMTFGPDGLLSSIGIAEENK